MLGEFSIRLRGRKGARALIVFAGTVVARNYVAQARILHESFAANHPSATFATLIVDGEPEDLATEGIGKVVIPGDLAVSDADLAMMRTVYSVMEFSTAIKPVFLQWMFAQGAHVATYIDPDIEFYAPIDDVFERAYVHGVALTPHMLSPLPVDERLLTHADVMHAGIYNLGFVSTGPGSARFLAWWRARLRLEGFVDLARAQFTDQRWVDWAPSFSDFDLLKDKGLNAAYWNLHERPIAFAHDAGWTAGDRPLRFYHFSGYDPEQPTLLSKHQGPRPRILLSECPDLRELCDSYGQSLNRHGHATLRNLPYRHDSTPAGVVLTPQVRRACRASHEGADPLGELPPDPWEAPVDFEAWLTGPVLGPVGAQFSRIEYAQWLERPDLQAAFPDVLGGSAHRFRGWLNADPGVREVFESAGVEAVVAKNRGVVKRAARVKTSQRAGGWSVIGYASAELGVGEASRRVGSALAATGLPWEMVGLQRGTTSRQNHKSYAPIVESPSYSNQIVCVNADQTPGVLALLGARQDDTRRIGLWFWELEEFPAHFSPHTALLDEIWVASEFCRAAIQPLADCPVRVVPLPASRVDVSPRFSKEQLGIPESDAMFVTVFDHFSVTKRKNPLGAIAAYREAFSESDGAVLVVKSINGAQHMRDRELVRLAARGRQDIVLMEDYMTTDQVHCLVAHSSCVVSLHRSEGFGLNLLDAMARGVPTIATGYSGNLQFQDESSAMLVPWTRVAVGANAAPYAPTATWAEPDLTAASRAMRSIVEDRDAVRRVVDNAYLRVDALAATAVAEQYLELLAPELSLKEVA